MASFLANNIMVKSPNVSKLFPEKQDDVVSGKDDVMNYWNKLNAEYFFSMKLIEFAKSAKTIHVKIEIGGSTIFLFATFVIDEYGKFITMEITYK